MGIPGLLIISFLDSAAVPMAGGPDAVLLLLCWERPALAPIIALACTVGSTLGCLVLYSIGERGGEKALSRFSSGKTDWVERKMERHGVWAIIAGVIAPPPFPTKVLVLAAGVLKIGKTRFGGAVLVGRILRYSAVAYLGAHFGGRASAVMKDNFPVVALLLICGIFLIYLIRALHNSGKSAGGTIFPTQGK